MLYATNSLDDFLFILIFFNFLEAIFYIRCYSILVVSRIDMSVVLRSKFAQSPSSLSKIYDDFFKQLIEYSATTCKTMEILNTVILCSAFSSINKKHKTFNDTYSEIQANYGNTFLSAIDKDVKKESVEDAFTFFKSCFSKNKSIQDFETILGAVLEKHINQKETGTYYTPKDSCVYIIYKPLLLSIINKCSDLTKKEICKVLRIKTVNRILTIEGNPDSILAKLKKLKPSYIDDIVSSIKKLKIIDPTCGSGAFILNALECLETINKKVCSNKITKQSLYKTLYGLDISKEGISFTKTRLKLRYLLEKNKPSNLFDQIDEHFVCADAFAGKDYVIDKGNGYDWKNLGKFDCIIGNPPYVEHKSSITSKFLTKDCGNLYAYTIERACNITHEGSTISFVVPLPFIATPRMEPAKDYLHTMSNIIVYSTFADRPGCLFSGVHQRLLVFFAEIGNEKCKVYTSSYNYWYKDERPKLFNRIKYYPNKYTSLPKVGNRIEERIYSKLTRNKYSLTSLNKKSGTFPVSYSTRIGFWPKAFIQSVSSNEFKKLSFRSKEEQSIAYAILNSSIFYFYWMLSSDCWHVTRDTISTLKFDHTHLSKSDISALAELNKKLSDDLEKNKKKINTKQIDFEYKHKLSKSIIDQIDLKLKDLFGLNKTEINYIINYTLKYRMNDCMKD